MYFYKRMGFQLWLVWCGVVQWVECQPANPGVSGSIPSQGTCLGFQLGPQWFLSHINVLISLPLSLPL